MRKPIFKQAQMTADNDIYNGQSVEEYVSQAETSKQPIEGGAPIIFTARKDGVIAEYNVRTDRFELAQNAMDKVAKSYQAKRAEFLKPAEPAEPAKETKAGTEGVA